MTTRKTPKKDEQPTEYTKVTDVKSTLVTIEFVYAADSIRSASEELDSALDTLRESGAAYIVNVESLADSFNDAHEILCRRACARLGVTE